MTNKKILLMVGLVIIATLVVTFPVATHAQQKVNENFVFVNYLGQEINLDLDDVTYVVPGTSVAPEGGRLVLHLTEGEHKFAANAPGVPKGAAGEFTIPPGGFVAKAARVEKGGVPVDYKGIVVDDPEDYIYVFDFDPFAAPTVETPAVVDTWQPAAATNGQGSLVWINHYGNDKLTIDMAGTLYKVPAQTNGIPGRLQIDLAPGLYKYTASLPNGGLNGEINVVAGQVTGLSITIDIPKPPEVEVGEPYQPLPALTLHLTEEDLTGQVSAAESAVESDSAPEELPNTGGEIIPAQVDPPGLVIKNYTGDTLIFTINGQTYMIDGNSEQILDLPSGQYTYTASLPFVATTGEVDLAQSPNLALSVVLSIEGDTLSVYPN